LNYKFVKITSFYRSFFEYYYSKKSDVITAGYDEQLSDIMSEGFGWADFFKINMEKIGNEAYEIVWNAAKMQKKWAKENNLNNIYGSDILYNQLKKIKPDVIFFQDSLSFTGEFIRKLRKDIPSIKLVIGWLCAPSTRLHLDSLKEFDFVCACSPEFLTYLNKNGIKAFELNHAFEPTLLSKIPEVDQKSDDLIFIGSFIGSQEYHTSRIDLIEALLSKGIDIKLFTSIPELSNMKMLSLQGAYMLSVGLKNIGLSSVLMNTPLLKKAAALNQFPKRMSYSSKFRGAVHPPLYGIEMLRELSKGKIGLNIHGGIAGDYAANSRMFEITGVGSLLLTDHKKNINDFFIPDSEAITYKTNEECKEKILWLLSHPAELNKISQAGHRKTLSEHTFFRRVEKLDEIIRKELKK